MTALSSPLLRCWRAAVAVFAAVALLAAPASAQSVLRDAETEALLNDMARPLVVAAGLSPSNVKIVLIGDKSINAFVAGGQVVYLNAGLLLAADDANEVQGVIAHELGHIVGGHAVLGAGQTAPTSISILSLLVGVAAMAVGAGNAGMAAMMAGQQAALGSYLAFSRTQESSADAFAVSTLNKAGVSGKGMVSFFGKLRKEEYRLSSSYASLDPFAQTHPLSSQRQATLTADLSRSTYWSKPTDPMTAARFKRMKAKLFGYLEDPPVVMRTYPDTDTSIPARYARAYAWHRGSYRDQAVAEVDALLVAAPRDPYYLELKGQVLLEQGQPAQAVAPLRLAVQESRNDPLIASLLGQALLATEDRANLPEARQVLKVAVSRDRDNPQAWRNLSIIYHGEGDRARAALATAEYQSMQNQPKLAQRFAETALGDLPQGSPDWIRAQDIALAARDEVEREKKRR